MAMRALEKGWAIGPGTQIEVRPMVRKARRKRARRKLVRPSLLLAALLRTAGERAIALAERMAH